MPEVIRRHALLFTVVLAGIVLLVLFVLSRQKASSSNAKAGAGSSAGTAGGDAGLTGTYSPSFSESVTNIYGSSGASDAPGSSGSGSSAPATGMPTGPIPPIAPPPASGANTVTTNAVYAGSAGRVQPEPGGYPRHWNPPISPA